LEGKSKIFMVTNLTHGKSNASHWYQGPPTTQWAKSAMSIESENVGHKTRPKTNLLRRNQSVTS
jgi:hypothetical protein